MFGCLIMYNIARSFLKLFLVNPPLFFPQPSVKVNIEFFESKRCMNFEFFVGERGKFKGVERWLGDIRVELLNPPSLSPSEDATGDYRLQPLDLRAQ